ncbi:MAG TPA: hypothetical protein VF482_06225 [Trebonia sp.]
MAAGDVWMVPAVGYRAPGRHGQRKEDGNNGRVTSLSGHPRRHWQA